MTRKELWRRLDAGKVDPNRSITVYVSFEGSRVMASYTGAERGYGKYIYIKRLHFGNKTEKTFDQRRLEEVEKYQRWIDQWLNRKRKGALKK